MKIVLNNSTLVFRHKREEEMNAFTKKVFSIANKYTIESQQAKKLNKIVSLLDNNGLLSHLKLFMAPALATTVEQALYNFASDHQYTNSNVAMDGEGIKLTGSNSRIDFITEDRLPTVNTFVYITAALGTGEIFLWNHNDSWQAMSNILLNTSSNNSVVKDIQHQSNWGGYAFDPSVRPAANKYRLIEISGLTQSDVESTSKGNGVAFVKKETIQEGWELTSPLTNFCVAEANPQKYIIMAFDGTVHLSDSLRSQLIGAISDMSEVI